MTRLSYSISVRHLNLARLGTSLRELSGSGIAEWRIDIADGTFTPDFALGYDVLAAVQQQSSLPVHVRLMVERPDRFIDEFARRKIQTLTVPIEACLHAHRTVNRIRELGMSPSLSIQPGSPLTKLEYVLPIVDHVVLPVRESGVETSLSGAVFDRVRILRENLSYHESKAILHVEGGLNSTEAARLAAQGASCIVIDRGDILQREPLEESVRGFIESVTREKKTV